MGPAVTPFTARAHAFVADLDAPRLTGDDHHHLTRVLRLGPGSDVTVGDGAGRWRPARLAESSEVVVAGDVVADARPDPPVTVAFALVKGDRPELTVQKLTELGVDRLVPFVAERSVVRWEPAKAQRQAERLAGIARHAAMQCRRTWLPRVDPLASFADVAALPGAALADRDGDPPTLAHPTALVGPEGGWAPAERAVGLPVVGIGPLVLRAETAAVTFGALLTAIRANIVAESQSVNARRG
ncbi:MAG TPA: RsmE family RNA methyltransferase [Acidimicrobiales bacterium]|nr:RsmE family RNA methyltransferase [Acidimicrobiales bacterium]